MPRIPSRPTVAPATATPNQPSTALSREGGSSDRFEAGSKPVFEAYFTPYEPAQKRTCGARYPPPLLPDETVYPEGENPYRIDYAVYNLRSKAVIKRLIEAAGSGSPRVGRGRSDLARAARIRSMSSLKRQACR